MTRTNNPDNLNTSINVKRTTRNKLNKLKTIPEEHLDSVINRLLKRINKGKKIKTPIFIENSPENFTVIFCEGDFKMIPFPKLTIKEKQSIDKFMEDILKETNKMNKKEEL